MQGVKWCNPKGFEVIGSDDRKAGVFATIPRSRNEGARYWPNVRPWDFEIEQDPKGMQATDSKKVQARA
jgi:cold shock CspA family protein